MQLSTAMIERMKQDPENAERMRQGQEFFARALTRSGVDPEFRRRLVNSPKATLVSFYNETHSEAISPDDIPWDIRFIEPTGDATFVLPDVIDETPELSEEELTAVVGGFTLMVGLGIVIGLVGVPVIGTLYDEWKNGPDDATGCHASPGQ